VTVDPLADLAVFFADLGRVVTYTKAGSSPVTLQGHYDAPAGIGAQFNEAPGIVQTRPQIVVRTSDVPAGADEGDAVEVAGVPTRYRVTTLFPDGTGLTRIELESTS
jgi:hypothetical protein